MAAADQNTFSVNIPASTPLADAHANAVAEDAPPIAAGAPRTLNDVSSCVRETKRRKLLKANALPTLARVTSDELAQSVTREVAVAMEVASGRYGAAAGAPLWAQQMQHALQQSIQDVQADLQGVQADLQAVRDDLQAETRALRAHFWNLRSRELNRKGEWMHVRVEQPGANDTGTVPPNHPESNEVFKMTRDEITALELAFNLPPGVFDGANVGIRREKVWKYLTEGF